MPLATTEAPVVDSGELLRGWDLGMIPPVRKKRIVFRPGKACCSVCGCGIPDSQWRLFQTCDSWRCRAQHRRQQRSLKKEIDERQRRQQEKLKRRVHLLRDKAAGLLGVDGPERFVCAVVPAIRNPVVRLQNERRTALGDHLGRLIAGVRKRRVGSPGNPQHESEPAVTVNGTSNPLPVAAQACAICQGYCCAKGGDQAYLNKETILRCLLKHPELGVTDVAAFFLSHLEKYTYKDSCIYHGENGCSLPRNVRSGTCIGFECTGVRRLIERLTGRGPHRAFLVAAENSQAVRYRFVQI